VILSKAFLSKNWPQYELNGLVAKEIDGRKVILPVWYEITKEEVKAYSSTLADKIALVHPQLSVEEIAERLAEVMSR
jgi:hypothetical protein